MFKNWLNCFKTGLFWRFRHSKLLPMNRAWKILSNALFFMSNGGLELELWSILCPHFFTCIIFYSIREKCFFYPIQCFFLPHSVKGVRIYPKGCFFYPISSKRCFFLPHFARTVFFFTPLINGVKKNTVWRVFFFTPLMGTKKAPPHQCERVPKKNDCNGVLTIRAQRWGPGVGGIKRFAAVEARVSG